MKARLRFDHSAQAWRLTRCKGPVALLAVANESFSDGEARLLAIHRGHAAGSLSELIKFLRLEAAVWDSALIAVTGIRGLQPYTDRCTRLIKAAGVELRA